MMIPGRRQCGRKNPGLPKQSGVRKSEIPWIQDGRICIRSQTAFFLPGVTR